MTNEKEKELIEGCPWRMLDVYRKPLCKAMSHGSGNKPLNYPEARLFKHLSACNGPDCAPMYFARAFLVYEEESRILDKIKSGDTGYFSTFGMSSQQCIKNYRKRSLEFINQPSPEKTTGEGDVPTTEPDETTDAATPSYEYIFLKETADEKDHPSES